MSDIEEIQQYFAGETNRVGMVQELFVCANLLPRSNCSIPQNGAICSDDQVCKGPGIERYSRCCFDGCQYTCTLPPVVDWINSPIRDSEPGVILSGPEAPDMGNIFMSPGFCIFLQLLLIHLTVEGQLLCSLNQDTDFTLKCPHGYICKEMEVKADKETGPDWGVCVTGNVCELGADKGRCQNTTARYFYDFQTNTCKRFTYTGCGGNDNNFKTMERCRSTCQESSTLLPEQRDKDLFVPGEEPPSDTQSVIQFQDPCAYSDCNTKIGEKCILRSPQSSSLPGVSLDEDRIPVCTCDYPCTEKINPVCASDDHQYENECLMQKHMCHNNITLFVTYSGHCNDPCNGLKCGRGQFCVNDYQTGLASCECRSSCGEEQDSDLVCGSNGKWYPSQCWLELAACHNHETINVVHIRQETLCGTLKPGSCPVVTHDPARDCHSNCSSDSRCPGKQKCCFNGCQHICLEASFDRDCEYNGHFYKNSAKFSEGCRECICKRGRVHCSVINCIPVDNIYSGVSPLEISASGAFEDDDEDHNDDN
jgi:hypothetical protein